MKKCFVAAIILFASNVYAQTPPMPSDPRVEMYRQLLSEANDRVVSMSAQTQQLQQQVQTISKQLADAKAKEEKPKDPPAQAKKP